MSAKCGPPFTTPHYITSLHTYVQIAHDVCLEHQVTISGIIGALTGDYRLGFNPWLDGRPKASIATANRPVPKLCGKRDARRRHGAGALRIEAVSIPKYCTLRISKGQNRNIPC